MLRDNYVIKLLFGEQGTAAAVVGTVVWGIEGLYADRGHLEGAALGDQELLGDDGVLFGIGIEPVFRAVGEDAAVAVGGESVPAGYAERTQPPAVLSGKLVRRPQGSGPWSRQLDETAVFLVPDTVFGEDLVTDAEFISIREFIALNLSVYGALHEEAALYGESVAGSLDFLERLCECLAQADDARIKSLL